MYILYPMHSPSLHLRKGGYNSNSNSDEKASSDDICKCFLLPMQCID